MSRRDKVKLHIEARAVVIRGAASSAWEPREPRGGQGMLDDGFRVIEQETRSAQHSAAVALSQDAFAIATRSAHARDPFDGGCNIEGLISQVTALYGREDRNDDSNLASRAAGYASLIAAISRKRPDLDYRTPIGQMLESMIRLFYGRNNGWKLVYKHLRAIPDSVEAKRPLRAVCLADIREWFDAGVQDLFSLQREIEETIQQLSRNIANVESEIAQKKLSLDKLRRRSDTVSAGSILALDQRVVAREITALKRAKSRTLEERERRLRTLRLIESDIREFERRLQVVRRVYFVRAV